MKPRRYLNVSFDVTDLTPAELDGLTGEVVAQGEASEHHPTVEVEVYPTDGAMRGSPPEQIMFALSLLDKPTRLDDLAQRLGLSRIVAHNGLRELERLGFASHAEGQGMYEPWTLTQAGLIAAARFLPARRRRP